MTKLHPQDTPSVERVCRRATGLATVTTGSEGPLPGLQRHHSARLPGASATGTGPRGSASHSLASGHTHVTAAPPSSALVHPVLPALFLKRSQDNPRFLEEGTSRHAPRPLPVPPAPLCIRHGVSRCPSSLEQELQHL